MDSGSLDSFRLKAIRARIAGEWDNPALQAYGPLGVLLDDITHIITADDPRPTDPVVEAYRRAAADHPKVYDGDLEVDGDATVSMGDDPGAYVSAWLWIRAEDAGICPECGEPNADNGEGWNGLCGNCADRAEADEHEEEDA